FHSGDFHLFNSGDRERGNTRSVALAHRRGWIVVAAVAVALQDSRVFRQWEASVTARYTPPDVLVAGGGNAALCAALCARETGASVTLVESAPQHLRAGNSRHARNFRVMSDAYPENEYFCDLLRVTGGHTNEDLARLAIRSIPECMGWM